MHEEEGPRRTQELQNIIQSASNEKDQTNVPGSESTSTTSDLFFVGFVRIGAAFFVSARLRNPVREIPSQKQPCFDCVHSSHFG